MAKHPGGRPPISEDQRLSKMLRVRLTEEQYEKLAEVATMTGMYTVSELIRFWIDWMIQKEEGSGHYRFLSAHTRVTTGVHSTLLDPYDQTSSEDELD